MHVSYDSDIADEFNITTQDGRTIKFPANEWGLYVKETYQQMKQRLDQLEEDENEQDATPQPLIRVDIDSNDKENEEPPLLMRFGSADSNSN